MQILGIINGEYGERHISNIQKYCPADWNVQTWRAPSVFPLVIDYPEDYLPNELPKTDLLLSFAEHRGVAELLPEIAEMTGVKAVIAAIDNESWLPRGLARQLRGWLDQMGIPCATPKPLCSLTQEDYAITRRSRIRYESPLIAEFARFFGKPGFKIAIDSQTQTVLSVAVERDAVCGCARYVAENLIGVSADEAEEKAGLLHHHFPCLASMGVDTDFADTLMHVSGNIMRDEVLRNVKPYKTPNYIKPGSRSE